MNFLKKLSIRTQLFILSGLFLIIILLLGIKAISDGNQNLDNTQLTHDSIIEPLLGLANAIDTMQQVRAQILSVRFYPEKRSELIAGMPKFMHEFDSAWQIYVKSVDEIPVEGEKELVEHIKKAQTDLHQDIQLLSS